MNRIRFVFALAALLLWAPAGSQTAGPQRSSLPSRELAPAQLLAELLKGGYILYFRHAATDLSQNDERMKSYEDCANQRNLIDRGRSEARAAAAAIRNLGIPVGRVLASPFCRTVETAQLLFGRAEKMQEVRGGPSAPTDAERYAALRRILATPIGAGSNLAGKLRERDNGNLELLGERLERARDLGDLGRAVLAFAGGLHQLEVVDHDQPERAVLPVQPPRARAQLERVERARFVDEDGRV